MKYFITFRAQKHVIIAHGCRKQRFLFVPRQLHPLPVPPSHPISVKTSAQRTPYLCPQAASPDIHFLPSLLHAMTITIVIITIDAGDNPEDDARSADSSGRRSLGRVLQRRDRSLSSQG